MPQVHAAAVYARISLDQDGAALGVKRELMDCQRLADELGWVVAEEYVDNDVSAFSGTRRPNYERMLTDISEGARDAVLVYHLDRLTRLPIELEHFVEVVTSAGISHVRFVSGGDLDLGTGDGLLVARMLAAVAANESASKSRRVRRKLEERAAEGRPHGGSNRPFGYCDDKVTIRPDEAEVIRILVARYLAGESGRSLAMWLQEEGVATVRGNAWRVPTVKAIIRSPRIAGLREHRGQVIGPAAWEPIISEADLAVSGRRAPRRYLLSGLLRCGRCGNTLFSSARATRRRYVCVGGPDHGGCGRLTVVAPPVEELIADAVLYRLDTPELADKLAGRSAADADSAAMAEAVAQDRAQLDELAGLYAARAIPAREWLAARSPIESRIRDAEKRLARLTNNEALADLLGNGAQLGAQWAGLNLDRQHSIVRAVLDHAVIAPGASGARQLDGSGWTRSGVSDVARAARIRRSASGRAVPPDSSTTTSATTSASDTLRGTP